MSNTECEFCKKAFEVDTSQRNWRHVRYCSDTCRKAIAAAAKRAAYKPKEIKDRRCKQCGSVFSPGVGQQKFCSKACSLEAQRERKLVIKKETRCLHCGTPFTPGKYSSGKQKYCSKTCLSRAISKRHRGKYSRSGSYQYEFNAVKPLVLERDGKCVLCGSTNRLHIHHWDNSGRGENCNNSLDNLGVLCGDCHSAIHKVTLVKVNGKWAVNGRIFDLVEVSGLLPIHR